MTRDIPYISEEMMADVEAMFAHGYSRAKNHDDLILTDHGRFCESCWYYIEDKE